MGYSPTLWGRQAWHFIHFIALNYPEKPKERDKKLYTDFLNALPHVLPCPICGSHFMDFMALNQPKLNNKYDFFKWTVDAHNDVNKRYNKKVISYEEAWNEVWKNATDLENEDNKLKVATYLKKYLLKSKINI
jgi:FAD-linked sulfhydryl oxidase